jgi:hypothetical protein
LQASVNPKAETVEELQSRRKNIHMGMCELLRQDLSLEADSRLSAADDTPSDKRRRIKACILRDLDGQTREHDKQQPQSFNNDTLYKRLMNEAIDGKALALLKLDIYLESVRANHDSNALDLICDTPLAEFGNPASVLLLRTGITQFPWAAVMEKESATIDLAEWDAASIPPQAQELVSGALGGNSVIRTVIVKGVKLELSDGWATADLKWAGSSRAPNYSAAINALPATVALVLQNCSRLTSLDLRCALPVRTG